MSDALSFSIVATSPDARARVGRVTTPHGGFDTPAFMPVGTRGTVKGILPHLVAQTGAQMLLNNTYHLLLRPGPEIVEQLGGVHRFMGWPGPILTDSGGYQAYSMADINAVDDDGVTFKSIVDGSEIRLTPERAMRVQNQLGADIIMAFDDCPPSVDPRSAEGGEPGEAGPVEPRLAQAVRRDAKAGRARRYDHEARLRIANERTVRWLERCKSAHEKADIQALFGIVQGGTNLAERAWSAERITNIELPGYSIGGVAVGETSAQIAQIVSFTAPLLPAEKPRYLMGVGYERDLVAAVRAGVDMFDCVLPTRNGRNASAFTRTKTVRLRNSVHAYEAGPIEAGCDCPACLPSAHGWGTIEGRPFSRGYLRHLFMAEEMLGPILVSLHNLRHFQRLMADIRQTIPSGDWEGLWARWPVARPVADGAASSPDQSGP